jgi:hypothetical protein
MSWIFQVCDEWIYWVTMMDFCIMEMIKNLVNIHMRLNRLKLTELLIKFKEYLHVRILILKP